MWLKIAMPVSRELLVSCTLSMTALMSWVFMAGFTWKTMALLALFVVLKGFRG